MPPSDDAPAAIDPNALLTLLRDGAWAPLVALLVYVGVTFVKDDTRLPDWLVWIRMPSPARPFAGTALALVASIALSIFTGIPVRVAFTQAAAGILTAILFHHGVIEGARGGQELPFPWLRPKPPAPPAVPSFPPVPPDDYPSNDTTLDSGGRPRPGSGVERDP